MLSQADGLKVVGDVGRRRDALVEQVEIAVPVRVGLRQLALQFVGQGEVLMQARVVAGELEGGAEVADGAVEVLRHDRRRRRAG